MSKELIGSNNLNFVPQVKFKKTAQEKYDVAVSIAGDFILTFFNTCVDRKGETNSKKKFKAFIEDLLVLVDRPEWPASEMLLYLLCNLFVSIFFSFPEQSDNKMIIFIFIFRFMF